MNNWDLFKEKAKVYATVAYETGKHLGSAGVEGAQELYETNLNGLLENKHEALAGTIDGFVSVVVGSESERSESEEYQRAVKVGKTAGYAASAATMTSGSKLAKIITVAPGIIKKYPEAKEYITDLFDNLKKEDPKDDPK